MKELQTYTFENSFARLEEILNTMNQSSIALEESLRLYEEADTLLRFCETQLTQAETKIELLVKNRDGNIAMSEQGSPLLQPLAYRSS